MGIYYYSTVYYGISFREDEFSKMLDEIECELYGKATRNRCWDETDKLIKTINDVGGKNGDSIKVVQQGDYHGNIYSFLCIRESLHGSGPARGSFSERSFQLDMIDTKVWDALLRTKCVDLNLSWGEEYPWTVPAFHITAASGEGGNSAGFFYGSIVSEEDLVQSNLVEDLNISMDDLRDPNSGVEMKLGGVFDPLTLFIVREGDYNSLFLEVEGTRGYRGRFSLRGVDLTPWDRLLQVKCDRYQIQGKSPSFHLDLRAG